MSPLPVYIEVCTELQLPPQGPGPHTLDYPTIHITVQDVKDQLKNIDPPESDDFQPQILKNIIS